MDEKMTEVENFVKENLGKTVRVTYGVQENAIGMIVGISKNKLNVLISFTTENGWKIKNTFNISDGGILIHSPLNVTCWYVYLDQIELR